MAGHSKWANIKHRKSRQDEKRGREFSRLVREITVAARDGEVDNPRLKLALVRAQKANIAKDTIEKALARSRGEDGGPRPERVLYEGFGPGGLAVLVAVVTDNRNRSAGAVKHAFESNSGSLGVPGSAVHRFRELGRFLLRDLAEPAEWLLAFAEKANLVDITHAEGEDWAEIFTEVADFKATAQLLEEEGLEPDRAELVWIARRKVDLPDRVKREKAEKMIEELVALEDVEAVYSDAAGL